MVSKMMANVIYIILAVFITSSVGVAEGLLMEQLETQEMIYELEGKGKTPDNQDSSAETIEDELMVEQEQTSVEEDSPDIKPKEKISHIKKVLVEYPGYVEITNKQIFDDYVNNLPLQQRKNARRIIESGSTEEAVSLIADYERQKDHQKEHIKMVTDIVNNWTGMCRHQRAEKTIQDWLRKDDYDDYNEIVTGLKVKKTNIKTITGSKNAYIVYYTIAGSSSKQEYVYLVDILSNSVRSIYMNSELRKDYGLF